MKSSEQFIRQREKEHEEQKRNAREYKIPRLEYILNKQNKKNKSSCQLSQQTTVNPEN
jgi:hypothetical protein